MIDGQQLSPKMQEQIYVLQITEAEKHTKELLKDPVYQLIMWEEFFNCVERVCRKRSKEDPTTAARALEWIMWVFNEWKKL